MMLSSLSPDIINGIATNLQIGHAKALAQTSRYLYEATMPRWASSAYIRTPGHLESLWKFMDASRPRHLRKLSFCPYDLEGIRDRLPQLAQIIRAARGLTTISSKCRSDWMTTNDQLREALQGHTHLSRLSIHATVLADEMPAVTSVISAMECRLKHISLPTLPMQADLDLALSRHAPSLQSFTIGGSNFWLSYAPRVSTVCARVHTLHITSRNCVVLNAFKSVFPGLQTLRYHVPPSAGDVHTDVTLSWPKLDHVECIAPPIYRRHVRSVFFTSHGDSAYGRFKIRDEDGLRAARLQFLEDCSPTVLSIDPDYTLISALPRVAPGLKYLRLNESRVVAAEDGIVVIEKSIQQVAFVLKTSALHALQVSYRISGDLGCDFARALARDALETLTKTIGEAVISLTAVGFDMYWIDKQEPGVERRIISWYSIRRDGGGAVQIELLSDAAGGALQQQLSQMGP